MFLSLLAHAVLRVIAGGTLIYMSGDHLRKLRTPGASKITLVALGLLELMLGGMMVIGLLTQIAALGALGLSIAVLPLSRKYASYFPSPMYFVLLIGVSLSLFITGAGALAIDMPF
jgi:uncharacterized membrane protein YphA (DoxX/SURF4 family)